MINPKTVKEGWGGGRELGEPVLPRFFEILLRVFKIFPVSF